MGNSSTKKIAIIVGALIGLVVFTGGTVYLSDKYRTGGGGDLPVDELLEIVKVDNTPPTCLLSPLKPGPPKSINVTITDKGGGLGSINFAVLDNVAAHVPEFRVGVNNPVIVTVTKLDESKTSRFALEVLDISANRRECGVSDF